MKRMKHCFEDGTFLWRCITLDELEGDHKQQKQKVVQYSEFSQHDVHFKDLAVGKLVNDIQQIQIKDVGKPTNGASFPWMLHELHVASKRRWTWIYGDEANAGGLNETPEFLRPKIFWQCINDVIYTQHTLIDEMIWNCFASCFCVHPFVWANQCSKRGTIWLVFERGGNHYCVWYIFIYILYIHICTLRGS